MKKTLLGLMLGWIMLGVLQINAYAGGFTAFGPRTFTRGSGKPIVETVSFNIKNPDTAYTLKIYNGGINFEYSKVSSAVIKLNGSIIFDTSDFNQEVFSLQKQVNVSTGNQLQVELRSPPGSDLTVLLEGEDDTPPAVSINSPANGTYLNTPSVTVTGTAPDAISWVEKLTVNGTNTALSGEVYTSSIQLTEGQNTITATATDVAGNTGNASATVILDTMPPKIILDPIPSLTNKSQLTITGKIEDTSPITSLIINGLPALHTNNSLTAALNLMEGNNNIPIAATDKAGNTITTSANITLDTTAPVITITSPINGSTVTASPVTVTGNVDDSMATVTVNDSVATVSNNTFTSNIALMEGLSTITITATDTIGNSVSANLSVMYTSNDTTSPVITIISPANAGIVNTQTITVTGTIDDNTASVYVNGIEGTVANKTFTATGVKLPEGASKLVVTATDTAGNTTIASILVICITNNIPGPVISNLWPADGDVVNWTNYTYFWGKMDDPTAIVKVNGNDAGTWIDNKEGRNDVYFYYYGEPLLAVGANTSIITATNAAGGTTVLKVTQYFSPLPPTINQFTPADGSSTNANPATVTAIVSPGINGLSTVTINGVNAAIDWNWPYKATAVIPLNDGQNTITAIAADAEGYSTISTSTIYYENRPPVFSTTAPSTGALIDSSVIGYTLSKTITGGTVTISRTGGNPDTSSPYTYYLISPDMTSGTHTLHTGLNLANGAIYTISFDATDIDGFIYAAVSNDNIT